MFLTKILPGFMVGVIVLNFHSANAAGKQAYEWMPPEAESDSLRENVVSVSQEISPVIETPTPKATADLSKYTIEYLIDLEKFKISNDGTNAEETSRGINAALQEARAAGVNRIIFPKGTYLIHESQPIILNHQDTVIDLNGATIQMNTNGLPDTKMVVIHPESRGLRLTNGTLRGDRDTHDYKTVKSTHEHCRLLQFVGGSDLEIDHLTITNGPGFSITTIPTGARSRDELLTRIVANVMFTNIESGAYSDTGELLEDNTKCRTKIPYDLTKAGGEFEFGWMMGYMGFPFIKDRVYQVVFLDAEKKFIKKERHQQFKKVKVPAGAMYAQLEFNQPEVSKESAHEGASAREGYCGRITNFRPPTDVHFHHNTVTNNRALGMAFTGGVKWLIEDNHFGGNGGQAPGYAIDFEDGWEMMQSVIVRRNTFKDNKHDLVVCAGTDLLFEENQFEKIVVVYGRTYNYTFRKNQFAGRVSMATRSGILSLTENRYEGSPQVSFRFDGKGVADGILRLPGQTVRTPAIELRNETMVNIPKVEGTYLKFINSKLDQVNLIAGDETVLAWLEGCEITASSIRFEEKGPPVYVKFLNNKGSLLEDGPGIARQKEIKAAP